MSYASQYPKAYHFQAVEPQLFRVIDPRKCAGCSATTVFVDFSVNYPKPTYVCGPACFVKLSRLKHILKPQTPITDKDI